MTPDEWLAGRGEPAGTIAYESHGTGFDACLMTATHGTDPDAVAVAAEHVRMRAGSALSSPFALLPPIHVPGTPPPDRWVPGPLAPFTIYHGDHENPLGFARDECAQVMHALEAVEWTRTDAPTCAHWMSGHLPASDLSRRIDRIVGIANEVWWRYDTTYLIHHANRYDVGDGYDWHSDNGGVVYPDRKLSLVAMIEPAASGGLLQVRWGATVHNVELAAGDVAVFPSTMQHRVTPIIAGTRTTIVAWAHGEPFR